LFSLGVAFTLYGAEYFVRASSWLSDVTGISKAIMGATVVAFSTSAPELFVSMIATIKGYNGISMGNIVGSNICNLGVGFVIIAVFLPYFVRDKLSFWNAIILLFSSLLVMAFAFAGEISIWLALALLVIFIVFVGVQIKYCKDERPTQLRRKTNTREILWHTMLFVVGIVGIIFGSNLIVDSAKTVCISIGIPEHIMGLTIVAVGTSLPEIFTTIVAVFKREHAMSVGNLIGSNIFNITFILATIAFVSGGTLAVTRQTMMLDLPVAMLFAVIAVVPTLIWKRVFRAQGIILGVLYVAYIITICTI